MSEDLYDYDEGDGDGGNVGLAFGQGFFVRSMIAEEEDTTEIMSFIMPQYQICVQAFIVDDFDESDDLGIEVIPHAGKGLSYIRIARSFWEFIEDVAQCEHEASFFQGLVLGELLTGTAHRMVSDLTGQLPGF